MTPILELAIAVLLATAPTTAPEAAALAECRPDQLLGHVPSDEEVETHREGAIPPVEYGHGERPGEYWGFEVALRIDANGSVECYRLDSDFDAEPALNTQRRDWLQKLAKVRYRPFSGSRSSSATIVTETVREVERVESIAPPADVPLDQFVITLERTGCFGSCPSYTVEIRGDGSVTYTGRAFVDVEGVHRYRIPTADVARLVESMRTKNIWSSKTEYVAPITDNPSVNVTIKAGERSHRIHDYVGEMVGMPVAISEFEGEVDTAAKTDRWIRLSVETVDLLDQEGFDFASPEGTALLWRSVAERQGDSDKALLRLLQRGARADGALPADTQRRGGSLLDVALENGKTGTADALIENGALETGGLPDRAKVDAAFRAAVKGGKLSSVQRVWGAAGATTPSLEFDDEDEWAEKPKKRVPIALLLEKPYGATTWEGLQIAQWLAARGCDLHAAVASGDTLLHRAAKAGDVALLRYLLEQGAVASRPGKYGLPALGSADNEDVAMLLLEAGTDVSALSARGSNFREYATGKRWSRVLAWLDAHKR